jgi:hypothetical protein
MLVTDSGLWFGGRDSPDVRVVLVFALYWHFVIGLPSTYIKVAYCHVIPVVLLMLNADALLSMLCCRCSVAACQCNA